jgi:hypothetical protein
VACIAGLIGIVTVGAAVVLPETVGLRLGSAAIGEEARL